MGEGRKRKNRQGRRSKGANKGNSVGRQDGHNTEGYIVATDLQYRRLTWVSSASAGPAVTDVGDAL